MTKVEMEKAMASAYHLPTVTNAQWDPHVGQRIGDASNPGPEGPAFHDEPPDDFVDASEESEDELYPDLAESSDDLEDRPPRNNEYGWNADSDSDCGDDNAHPAGYSTAAPDSDYDARSSSSTAAWSEAAHSQSLHEQVIPPWDAKLSDDQVALWKAAEDKIGIKHSVKSWLTAKRKWLAIKATATPATTIPSGADFAQANLYNGPRQGYVFGTREGKLGYHRDQYKPPMVTLCLAEELAVSSNEASKQRWPGNLHKKDQKKQRRSRQTDQGKVKALAGDPLQPRQSGIGGSRCSERHRVESAERVWTVERRQLELKLLDDWEATDSEANSRGRCLDAGSQNEAGQNSASSQPSQHVWLESVLRARTGYLQAWHLRRHGGLRQERPWAHAERYR